jgi:hypothetical protein
MEGYVLVFASKEVGPSSKKKKPVQKKKKEVGHVPRALAHAHADASSSGMLDRTQTTTNLPRPINQSSGAGAERIQKSSWICKLPRSESQTSLQSRTARTLSTAGTALVVAARYRWRETDE